MMEAMRWYNRLMLIMFAVVEAELEDRKIRSWKFEVTDVEGKTG